VFNLNNLILFFFFQRDLHKPSLVGVDKAFKEYTGDIIDTLEDYPGVLWVGSVFVRIADLGGRVSGGDGGVVQ
jgi:hypothetical protein